VGQSLADRLRQRGWQWADVRAIRLSNNELPTARERTDGATRALLAAGMPVANIIETPQRGTDTEAGFNATAAALARNPGSGKWLLFALNEDSVLGGVRATEQLGLTGDSVIGIGIGGTGAAIAEFRKARPTGFAGTIALPTEFHGAQSARNLVAWINGGPPPPAQTVSRGMLMTHDNWQATKKALTL
jgi:L-arabinose transport system substrate-binding protein